MEWHDHSRDVIEGSHAFLGASKYSWLNYDEDKLVQVYKNEQAKLKGTLYHALACQHIQLKLKMPNNNKTFNRYVNDAIGFDMTPEQVLYFSKHCFGTADAISFKRNQLRIHDLKTGTTPASLHQLEIYASLFCLEYNIKPGDINIELRIYQNDDILIGNPHTEDILPIMDKIVIFDRLLTEVDERGE